MRRFILLFCLLASVVSSFSQLVSQELLNTWTGNFAQISRNVNATAVVGDTAIVGGLFELVTNPDGLGTVFPFSYDSLKSNLDKYPNVNFNEINNIILPYENKGKILVGRQIIQGKLSRGLAILDSNYQLVRADSRYSFTPLSTSKIKRYNDTIIMGTRTFVDYRKGYSTNYILDENLNFSFSLMPDYNYIECVETDGTGGYFAGGSFSGIDGEYRKSLAHYNIQGELTDWNVSTNGTVYALKQFGDTLFVGGKFSKVNGIERSNLAVIHIPSGNVLPMKLDANDTVYVLQNHGNDLHVGGAFTLIGGQSRGGYARVSLSSGVIANSFAPAGSVQSMAISNSLLYLGGYFKNTGLNLTTGLLICNLSNGQMLNSWLAMDAPVSCFAVKGDTVFAGGQFTKIGTNTTHSLIAFRSGSTVPFWKPNYTISSFNGKIDGLGILNNELLVMGDILVYDNGINYSWSIKLNANTLGISGNGITEDVSKIITTGGHFVFLNRNTIATNVHDANGNDFWMFDVKNDTLLGKVEIVYNSNSSIRFEMEPLGDKVLISGYLSKVQGNSTVKHIVEYNVPSQTLTGKNVKLPSNFGDIKFLGMKDSSWLVADFATSYYFRLSMIPYGDSTPNSTKTFYGVEKVKDVTLYDTNIYVFGDFPYFSLDTSSRIVGRIGLNSWEIFPTNWKIYHTTLNNMSFLKYYSHIIKDDVMYLLGEFTSAMNSNRYYLAAIDLKTDQLLSGDIGCKKGEYPLRIADAGNEIIARGYHKSMAVSNISGVTLDGNLVDLGIGTNSMVNGLHAYGDTLIIAGNFSNFQNSGLNFLVKYNVRTKTIATNWVIPLNSHVHYMYATDSLLFVSGPFTYLGSQPVNRLIGINKFTGALIYSNPLPGTTIINRFTSYSNDTLYYMSSNNTMQVVDIQSGSHVRTIHVKPGPYDYDFSCRDDKLHFVGFDSVLHINAPGWQHMVYDLANGTLNAAPYISQGISGNHKRSGFLNTPRQFWYSGDIQSVDGFKTLGIFEMDPEGNFTGKVGGWIENPYTFYAGAGLTDAVDARDTGFVGYVRGQYSVSYYSPYYVPIKFSANIPNNQLCVGDPLRVSALVSRILPSNTIWKLELYPQSDFSGNPIILLDTIGGSQPVMTFAYPDSVSGTYYVKIFCATGNHEGVFYSGNSISFQQTPKAIPVMLNSDGCLATNYFEFQDSLPNQNVATRTWTFAGLANQNGINPIVSFADTGWKNVKLELISSLGCKDDSVFQIRVSPSPLAAFLHLSDACVFDTISFFDSSLRYGGGINWYLDGTYFSNTDTAHVYFNMAGVHSMLLNVVTPEGCIDSAIRSFNYHPLPETNLLINDTAQCFGANSFDIAFISNKGANTQSAWLKFNDTTYLNDLVAFHMPDTGAFKLHLYTESQYACKDSFETNIYVWAEPVSDAAVIDTAQCENDNLFSFINQGSVSSLNTHTWLINDTFASSFAFFTRSFNQSGAYTGKLIIETPQGCVDSSNVMFHVLPAPQIPTITYSGDSLRCDSGYMTYFWYRNDTLLSSSSALILHPQKGVYKVVVMNADSCSETSSPYSHVPTGLMSSFSYLKIYPNPAGDYFIIEYSDFIEGQLNLELSDASGRKIKSFVVDDNITRIDTRDLTPGVYFIHLSGQNDFVNYKLIIQ